MPGTISDHWLTYFVIPLAACSISLLTWRVLVRRGWNRILPVLNLYVIFSSLTSVMLLLLSYLQRYAGAFWRLSAAGDQITGFMTPLLLAAAIVELAKHGSGQDAAARRTYTLTITAGMVSLVTLSACLMLIPGRLSQAILEKIVTGARGASSLIIFAFIFWLLVGMRRHIVYLEGRLTLIPIIVGAYYLLDFVSSFVIFSRTGTAEQHFGVQNVLWFAYATALYWVLARQPRTPQGELLPTEQ